MSIRRIGLVGLTIMIGLLATVLVVHLAAARPNQSVATPDEASAVAEPPFLGAIISGTVATPDGGPLPPLSFVWMREPDPLHNLDYDIDTHGRSDVISGTYSFANVAPGRYLLRAVPRDLPPFKYAPSAPAFVNVFTESLFVPLTVTFPSVTGTLYADPGGVLTPSTGIVHVYTETNAGLFDVERRWVWPENNGVFVVGGLPTGTFKFQAEPLVDDDRVWSEKKTLLVEPAAPKVITLTLGQPQVAGRVWMPLGGGATFVPVSEARVHAVTSQGEHRFDVTGPLGLFSFGDLTAGSIATLTVAPPPGLNWLFPPLDPITTIVPGSPPPARVAITMTVPDKQLHGWVRTNQVISQPVQNALVEAHRVGSAGYNRTRTDPRGVYTLTLAPGLWAVTVKPVSDTVPSDWVYPFEARTVGFEYNRLPEHKLLNFRVWVADAQVMGAVELPPRGSGTPPNFTVTVSLRNDEGLGLSQMLDASGHYTFNVPHGPYKIELRVASPLFAAPQPRDIQAHSISPTPIPTITLIARNALISGTLTAQGSGQPVEGVPVVAWNPDTRATFVARSDSQGIYTLAVYSDTWLVRPAPLPDQPYVYTGPLAASVQAITRQVTRQDFQLTPANATIHGLVVNEHNTPVTNVRGWAVARDGEGVRNGAPIEDGLFDILVPDGTYTVALNLPTGQVYLWDGQAATTTVSAGNPQTVTLRLVGATAKLWGEVWNVRTNKSVGRDVNGGVWAWDNGMWTSTDIKPGNFYTLPVPAGDWSVNYAIDPSSDFVKTAGPRTYAVPSGTVTHVPLPVVEKDGQLTGAVWITTGVPARGAVVIAEAISADIQNVTLRTPVDYAGRFTMTLPSGLYNVRSVLVHGDPRLINPRLMAVNVPRNGSASVTLMYRQANALITGTVTAAGAPPTATGPVHVYGWTADDGYNSVIAPLNGVYTLPVLAGQTWKVAAVYEWPNRYWITRTMVTVPGAPGSIVNQDLVLKGPQLKPAPVIVMFDAAQDHYIELSDGTRIYIPAGALPASGRVILHITPIANAVHHRNGEVLGLSYVFEAFTEDGQPITENFNQAVVIVFKYAPVELMQMGINVNQLRPAYFSTTTNSWTAPDSFVVDEASREITLQIDHFTQFSLVNTEGGTQVFLPSVIR